jgi:hypothetical protein
VFDAAGKKCFSHIAQEYGTQHAGEEKYFTMMLRLKMHGSPTQSADPKEDDKRI